MMMNDDKNLIAHSLLQEVSGQAYTRSTAKLVKETNIDPNTFPSHYKLSLGRPIIDSHMYGNTDTTTSITGGTTLSTIDAVIDSVKDEKNHNDVKMIAKKLHKNKGRFLAAKIDKGYDHILSMMIEKHIKQGREVKGNIMVLDCSDGALHASTNTKDSGIVSYSSQVFHPDFFAHGISTASSNNILTYMNSLTDKTMATVFRLIIPILEQQALL